jgi:hypothetical protein
MAALSAAAVLAGCNAEPVFNATGRCLENCKGLRYLGKNIGTGAAGSGTVYCATSGDCYAKP